MRWRVETGDVLGWTMSEADATSRLTHLPVPAFLKHFNTTFPQPTPWRLYLLPYRVAPRLHTTIITNNSLKASPLQEYSRITQRGINGTPSSHGCAPQPTYKASVTPHPSYKYFLTRYTQDNLQQTTSPSTG